MKTLYLIDILDDPDHRFTEVFDRFLTDENLPIPYFCISGLHPQVDYQKLLDSEPGGIIISGSLQSVYDRAPWMLQLEAFIRQCADQDIPVLGLCFGHQIIASAMGGTVETLRSWEFGVQPVFLQQNASEHPWLNNLPASFNTIQVHQDHVSQLPPGAQSLAASEKTPHQIFALKHLMGVQFHPEYTVDMLHTIIRKRHQKLVDKGPFTSEDHLKNIAQYWRLPEVPRHILKNFLRALNLS